jgi:hypothetical protein
VILLREQLVLMYNQAIIYDDEVCEVDEVDEVDDD